MEKFQIEDCEYSPVSTSVSGERSHTQRRKCCGSRRDIYITIILALLLFLVIGAAAALWFTNAVDYIILQYTMVLKKGSTAYKLWVKPPVQPLMKVYIYNYTNIDEFGKYEGKIRVQELGPYTYRETLEKVNVEHNYDRTISFQNNKRFTFLPEKSRGSPSDEIFVPNVPLMAAVSYLKNSNFYIKTALSAALSAFNAKPFIKLTVDQYLWGYEEPLIAAARQSIPGEHLFPSTVFGILTRRQGRSKEVLTIYTGESNINKRGVIARHNGKEAQTIWASEECNRLDGSEGSIFPPFITEDTILHIYSPEVCRRLPFVFDERVMLKKVDGFRFRLEDDSLIAPERNPENACYCPDRSRCAPSGFFNASECFYGAPVLISYPRFYKADSAVFHKIEGIEPKIGDDDFYIDVQNKFGIPLSAKLQLQFNIMAQDVSEFHQYDIFHSNTILPLVWIEESFNELPPVVLEEVRYGLRTSKIVSRSVVYGLLAVGVILLIFLIWCIFKRSHRKPYY